MIIEGFPRAIIFDWDDTLVDSWGVIAASVNYVRHKYGYPVWSMAEMHANCGRSARDNFPIWFGDKWEPALKDYYDYFEKARAENGIKPMKGAAELLEWLHEEEFPLIVVSNKKHAFLVDEIAQLGWQKYFAAIAGAGSAPRDKPAREHADYALTKAGLKAGPHVWFIGDSESDITCARNAGCEPILIGDSTKAAALKIDMFVSDCQQLLQLLINFHEDTP